MSATATRKDRHAGGSPFRRLYRGQTQFDFINRWKYWFALSGAVIAVGLVALGVGGLNFSIDFKGGTVWQVPTNASVATVRADISKVSSGLGQATITQLTNRQTGHKEIEVQAAAKVTGNVNLVNRVTAELAKIGHVPVRDVNTNLVGPSWGSSITSKAIEAVVVFLVLISICIALYFEAKMAIGALVALVHDMLVTVGIYALSGFQVSPDTVIAFLTVLGYSLYDTIVVFDKVKENTRGLASTNRFTYTDVVNLSMNQVMARSVNTSFVAIMPVFCILVIGSWIMGATALNDFGLALFIGLMSGAYSSIFIASPILALLKEREPRYVEIRRRLAAYPQSRQALTPSSVVGGVLVAPRQGAAGSAGAGAAAGAGSPGSPLVAALGAAGALPARPGKRGVAGARSTAGNGALAGSPAGFESYAGPARRKMPNGATGDRGAAGLGSEASAAAGVPQGGNAGAGAAGAVPEGGSAERAFPAGTGSGGSAPAGAGATGTAGPAVPPRRPVPRSRKKVPRRR
jgi:preprotein translocase subunit SecF